MSKAIKTLFKYAKTKKGIRMINGLVLGLVFFIDQISKLLARQLNFTNWSVNEYLSFSIPVPKLFIFILVLVVLIIVIDFWRKSIFKKDVGSIWLALVIGGAVSNLVDRIIFGGVIDWINANFLNITTSSFNIADVFIVIGVFGLVYRIWYSESKK